MFENKIIIEPKLHFKLEIDIKTDNKNIENVLETIIKITRKEFNDNNLVAEVMPTITKIKE